MFNGRAICISGISATALLLVMPANAQRLQRADPVLQCFSAVLHLTERGFAFECPDRDGQSSHVMVVRDDEFEDRAELVAELVRELNSRGTGSGRSRSLSGLWVTYRPADEQAQAVCASATPRFRGADCSIAVSVAYR